MPQTPDVGDPAAVGVHLIVDLFGACRLDDEALMRSTLQACVKAAGATLLHLHLHRFTEHGGLSGVVVLAESHIAVHTWPETGFAAFDLFMCGQADPRLALPALMAAFEPQDVSLREIQRGPKLSA